MAPLTELVMAEMVLNPGAQRKVQEELYIVVGKGRSVSDSKICKLPYMKVVVVETLEMNSGQQPIRNINFYFKKLFSHIYYQIFLAF